MLYFECNLSSSCCLKVGKKRVKFDFFNVELFSWLKSFKFHKAHSYQYNITTDYWEMHFQLSLPSDSSNNGHQKFEFHFLSKSASNYIPSHTKVAHSVALIITHHPQTESYLDFIKQRYFSTYFHFVSLQTVFALCCWSLKKSFECKKWSKKKEFGDFFLKLFKVKLTIINSPQLIWQASQNQSHL